jgi:hypothetical protein
MPFFSPLGRSLLGILPPRKGGEGLVTHSPPRPGKLLPITLGLSYLYVFGTCCIRVCKDFSWAYQHSCNGRLHSQTRHFGSWEWMGSTVRKLHSCLLFKPSAMHAILHPPGTLSYAMYKDIKFKKAFHLLRASERTLCGRIIAAAQNFTSEKPVTSYASTRDM